MKAAIAVALLQEVNIKLKMKIPKLKMIRMII